MTYQTSFKHVFKWVAYGISTLVGYLMPNVLFIYIYIYIYSLGQNYGALMKNRNYDSNLYIQKLQIVE